MKQNEPRHSVQLLFVVLLMGLFALMSVLLVLLGTQAYQGSVERTEQHNRDRVAANYIRSALRSEDADRITVRQEGEIPVLEITRTDTDGETYIRRIFCHDGKLRDSYVSASRPFTAEDGEVICEMARFEPIIVADGILADMTTPSGQSFSVFIALRATGSGQ